MKPFLAFFTKALQKRDGPTDERTDGRTDTPSYRDGWTHLKMQLLTVSFFDILTRTEIPSIYCTWHTYVMAFITDEWATDRQ